MGDTNIGGFLFRIRPYLRPSNEYTRRHRTDYIVVHCSATKPTADVGAEEIREWHVKDNHWLDIGYHYVVRRDGSVELGRPSWAVGSGVAGHNSNTIHICLVGGVDNDGSPEDNFTPRQKAALAFLIANIKTHINPKADVCGHRDFPGVKKACPSFDAKAWWGSSSVAEAAKGFTFRQVNHGEVFSN